jgi:hypothetical protein
MLVNLSMELTLMSILMLTKIQKGIMTMKLRITMALHQGSRANFIFQAHGAIVFNYFNVPNGREEWCTDFVMIMAIFMFPVAIVDFYYLEV